MQLPGDPYVPAAQALEEHTRSVVAVPALDIYWPALQAVSVEHALPSVTLLKLVPTTHGVHVRSTVAVPSCNRPSPAGQLENAAHASGPAVALKWSAGHREHTLSAVALGAVVSVSPAGHAVCVEHTRSTVVDGAVVSYWPVVQVV